MIATRAWGMVLAAGLVGCAASSTQEGSGGDAATTTSSVGQGGHGGFVSVGGGGGGEACDARSKLIYAVDNLGTLHSFDPKSLELTTVGAIDCPHSQMGFYSLAVGREGYAWALDAEGRMFEVDLDDASCKSAHVDRSADTDGAFVVYGMGFVFDAGKTERDRLYVASNSSQRYGLIDTASRVLTPLGSFGEPVFSPELTGTKDGRLFALSFANPPSLSQIDAATGVTIDYDDLWNVFVQQAWAIAFWGGDFWLFVAGQDDSKVIRYDTDTQTLTTVVEDLGVLIVGAGVSTCAPLEVPD